jgi:hypothetical protein
MGFESFSLDMVKGDAGVVGSLRALVSQGFEVSPANWVQEVVLVHHLASVPTPLAALLSPDFRRAAVGRVLPLCFSPHIFVSDSAISATCAFAGYDPAHDICVPVFRLVDLTDDCVLAKAFDLLGRLASLFGSAALRPWSGVAAEAAEYGTSLATFARVMRFVNATGYSSPTLQDASVDAVAALHLTLTGLRAPLESGRAHFRPPSSVSDQGLLSGYPPELSDLLAAAQEPAGYLRRLPLAAETRETLSRELCPFLPDVGLRLLMQAGVDRGLARI